LAGECLGVVVGELLDVCGWLAGDLGDRGGDCCFPAPVVCVVLQQALDLPWRQDVLQAGGEGFGRYAGEGDVAAERGAQRCGDLCVGEGVQEMVRSLSHSLVQARGGATIDDATLFLVEWRGGSADHLATLEVLPRRQAPGRNP
jgi:hypothetical protein